MSFKNLIAGVMGVFAVTSIANAELINFSAEPFSSVLNQAVELKAASFQNVEGSGIDLTLLAAYPEDATLSQSADGIGINSSVGLSAMIEPSEVLRIRFDVSVDVSDLTFNNLGIDQLSHGDGAEVVFYGSNGTVAVPLNNTEVEGLGDFWVYGEYDNSATINTTVNNVTEIKFVASNWYTDFTIGSMNVKRSVPEPTTLSLLGISLLGFVFIKRKK